VIVVTGAGRCGSSLMMQTLHLLGVPMIEDPENDRGRNTLMDADDTGKIAEKIIAANPKGYWELPIKDVYHKINHGFGEHNGRAIKIIGSIFTEVAPAKVEKVILCLRKSSYEQAEGLLNLAKLDLEIRDKNPNTMPYIEWFRGRDVNDVLMLQRTQLNHIYNNVTENKIPLLEIMFDDIVTNPQPEIEKVVRFLGLDVDISKAVENVDVRNETSV
tara:strand:- start:4978 stop:5625 length:648 start_codon:yes stop_codon:yes gene_type:complete